MSKTILPVLLTAFAAAYAGLHPTGYVEGDLGKTAPEREVKSIPVPAGAPSFRDLPFVDLSGEVPPAGDQGGIGSCASWGIAYYHRSQLEYRERRWDLTDPAHQFSPAFCYNQVNGGADRGSGFDNNMSLICEQGCASMADFPYGGSCTQWPSESAYSRALPFRCKEWRWFRTEDTAGLGMVKQLLCNGSTVPLAIWVWGNFDNISQYNYTYCSRDRTGNNRGGHIVTIVGYNDTLVTHDGRGAFKLVNSWGPHWGMSGFFWMSYEAVLDTFLCQRAVAFLVDTVGYSPQLLARVRIEHPTRDRVALDFIVGPRINPLWYRSFRTWRRAHVDWPFPDNNLVFDLTEAAGFIANRTTDSVYFCCTDVHRDGRGGTIRYMSGQYLPWGNIFPSGHTPVEIPDNGSTVCAGTRLDQYDPDASASRIIAPTGIVSPDSQYVPQAEVWNFGRSPASFPVILSISGGYADTAQVSGLGPGNSAQLRFRVWDAPARGRFTLRCSTALTGDQYPANNVCTDSVQLRFHDVAVTRITCPPDTVDSAAVVRPQVMVRNNGTQTEQFAVTFWIPDEGYMRRSTRSLEPDTEAAMTFATWIPKLRGAHALRCSIALDGDMEASNNELSGSVYVGPGAGIEEEPAAVHAFRFEPPSPSPFSDRVELSYALPQAARVSLAIFDATGAQVRSLGRAEVQAGRHRIQWDGRNDAGEKLPAGLYFCRLVTTRHRAAATVLKL